MIRRRPVHAANPTIASIDFDERRPITCYRQNTGAVAASSQEGKIRTIRGYFDLLDCGQRAIGGDGRLC
ncbi:hypothetical protein D3C80_1451020 [compost metagenome]